MTFSTLYNKGMTETEWKRYNQLKTRTEKLLIKWGSKPAEAKTDIDVNFDIAYSTFRVDGVCTVTASRLADFCVRVRGVTGVER